MGAGCAGLVLAVLVLTVSAMDTTFSQATLMPWNYDWSRVAMVTGEGAYAFSAGSPAPPSLSINLTFASRDTQSSGSVDVFLFPARKRYMVDFALSYMSSRRECPDLTTIDRLNIPSDAMDFHYRHWPYTTPAHHYQGGHEIGSIDEQFTFFESAEWYLYIFNCQAVVHRTNHGIVVDGVTTWRNPYGFLDATEYPSLLFNVGIAIVSIAVLVGWLVLLVHYRHNYFYLQRVVVVLLVLIPSESIFNILSLSEANRAASPAYSFAIIKALITVTICTFARGVALFLALGLGTTQLHIHRRAQYFLYGLLAAYFISLGAYEIVKAAPLPEQMSTFTMEVIQFPTVMFNLVLFGWLFAAIWSTTCQSVLPLLLRFSSLFTVEALCLIILAIIRDLRESKEIEKAALYYRFSRLMAASLLTGSVILCTHLAALATSAIEVLWPLWWMWNASWQLLYFLPLLAMMYMWRPCAHNSRYLITEEMANAQREEEERAQAMRTAQEEAMNLYRASRSEQRTDRDTAATDESDSIIDDGAPLLRGISGSLRVSAPQSRSNSSEDMLNEQLAEGQSMSLHRINDSVLVASSEESEEEQ